MSGPSHQRLTASEILLAIGRHLRWLREAWNEIEPGDHTQAAWAEKYGVSESTLSRWEAGLQSPDLDQLTSLALSALVDMNYLFFGVVPPEIPEPLALRLLAHEELQTPAQWKRELARARLLVEIQMRVFRKAANARAKPKRPRALSNKPASKA